MQQLENMTAEQLEQRITYAAEKEAALLAEITNLEQAELEAQQTADPKAVLAVYARGDELPKLRGLAKAEKLVAQADYEQFMASSYDDPEVLQRINILTAEIEGLQTEKQALQNLLDTSRSRSTAHTVQATEYRHEAQRLRSIHA